MGAQCSSSTTAASSPAANLAEAHASPKLVDLLGPTLLSKTGQVATANALGSKAIALYFSAHWCPPCRQFTPVLAKAYLKSLQAKGLEIVFVSSDRDAKAANDYYASQPWLALPFTDRERKQALGDKYGVRGIPALVLIDEHGELLNANGRAEVAKDPSGAWVRKPAAAAVAAAPKAAPRAAAGMGQLSDVLGTEPLLASDGQTKLSLKDAVGDSPLIGLYFSAHWCGPCRAFTPKLVAFVETLEKEGVKLPILFGSSDQDATAFAAYFAQMPWLALPFGDSRIEALKAKYQCSGIPWLVILDAQGNLVLNEADTDVPKGPQAYKGWLTKAKRASAGAPAA